MENIGIHPKFWGPSAWTFLHAITFAYPKNPTEEDKLNYFIFFKLLAEVLPCNTCRQSYGQYLQDPETRLDMHALSGRAELAQWLYRLHQKINQKLGQDYALEYKDLVQKYESFRGRLDCRQLYSPREVAIIMPERIHIFREYARIIGLDDLYCRYYDRVQNWSVQKIRHHRSWKYRNKVCHRIIKYMHIYHIPSREQGVPTSYELLLLLHLATNMCQEEFEDALKNVIEIIQKY